MARHMDIEVRSGPRYLVSFEVRAEWDEPGGTHILSEGTTRHARSLAEKITRGWQSRAPGSAR